MEPRAPRAAVRFHPPAVPLTPTLCWVLLRAFAAPEVAVDPPAPGEGHLLARRLGLAARIASRLERERLVAEVGAEEAASFQRDRLAVVAVEMGDAGLVRQLAAVAAERGVPLAFLKSTALRLGGSLRAGIRPSADLDLLVPARDAEPFQAALRARGFTQSAAPEMEHQLPTLKSPSGRAVEVHHVLLGLRPAGQRRSARFEDLLAAGLLTPLPELGPRAFLPCPAALAAHALVHALVQHGWAPHAYPALRLPADLADLGLLAPGREEAWERAVELVTSELAPAECAAVARLVRALEAGDLAALVSPATGEGALLHHVLAGTLHEGYGESLRFRLLAEPLSDLPRGRARWRSLTAALFPPASVLDAVYGGGGGRLRRLGLRFFRPFDLARRALRYRAAGRGLAGR